MKIIYFVNNPLLKRDLNLYGVSFFNEKNIDVIFFVLYEITSPNISHKSDLNYKNQEIFKSWHQLFKRLYEINKKDFLFISDSPLSSQNFALYLIFTILNIKYYFVDNWYVPATFSTKKRDNTQKINVKTIFSKIIKVLKYYGTHISYKIFLKKPLVIFQCVMNSAHSKHIKGIHSDIIPYCSFNYDTYIDTKNDNSQYFKELKPYYLFIDQYLDGHPDFFIKNKKPPVSKNYYKSVNKFFAELTEHTKNNCVVANHPRRPKSIKSDFNTKYVYEYETANLVKECEFVVAHYSMAIDLAVLFEKPILIITSNEIENSWVSKFIKSIAKSLEFEAINIDSPYDEDKINNTLKKLSSEQNYIYSRFRNNHICYNKDNNKKTYQIIYKEIERRKNL